MKRNLFSIRLKELREENGFLSQQQLANALNLSQSTIGNWEAGRRQPDYDMTCRLAGLFHVSVDYLIGNVNDPSFVIDSKSVLEDINELPNEKENAPTAVQGDERAKKEKLARALIDDLTEAEVQQVQDYIDFLISRRNQ